MPKLSEKCVKDPEKISQICGNSQGLKVSFTKNTVHRMQKSLRHTDNHSLDGQFAKNFVQNANKSNFMLSDNQINGLTCSTNFENKFDQLLVLPSQSAITDHNLSPIIPIKLPFKKCRNFVEKSHLMPKLYPNEVFDSMVREEVRRLN